MAVAIARDLLDGPGDGPPARPFPNSYWLLPGRLLAGEHPDPGLREALSLRLLGLQACGISCCIDLSGNSPSGLDYVPLPVGGRPVRRESWPIDDFGVPPVAHMRRILDAIASALEAGDGVYVHCRAGIGRTGTVVGCLLVEHGFAPDAALALMQRKWRAMARSAVVRQTPETDAQRAFIAAWSPGKGLDRIAPAG